MLTYKLFLINRLLHIFWKFAWHVGLIRGIGIVGRPIKIKDARMCMSLSRMLDSIVYNLHQFWRMDYSFRINAGATILLGLERSVRKILRLISSLVDFAEYLWLHFGHKIVRNDTIYSWALSGQAFRIDLSWRDRFAFLKSWHKKMTLGLWFLNFGALICLSVGLKLLVAFFFLIKIQIYKFIWFKWMLF